MRWGLCIVGSLVIALILYQWTPFLDAEEAPSKFQGDEDWRINITVCNQPGEIDAKDKNRLCLTGNCVSFTLRTNQCHYFEDLGRWISFRGRLRKYIETHVFMGPECDDTLYKEYVSKTECDNCYFGGGGIIGGRKIHRCGENSVEYYECPGAADCDSYFCHRRSEVPIDECIVSTTTEGKTVARQSHYVVYILEGPVWFADCEKGENDDDAHRVPPEEETYRYLDVIRRKLSSGQHVVEKCHLEGENASYYISGFMPAVDDE